MGEVREQVAAALHEVRGLLAGDVLLFEDCLTLADAVLPVASAAIARRIRRELVCCDVFDRVAPLHAEVQAQRPGWGEAYSEWLDAIGDHDICYWGETAARLAEGSDHD